ncbi:MAG: 50S ribosomal protein L38e [Candidatus Bathyarchaeia archaeon]
MSDVEEFIRISERADECRVKRLEDIVKLKLRTASKLYTIKLNADKAAEVLKQLKCEVVET